MNWIKSHKLLFSIQLPKGYHYYEQIQIHEDGTMKLESYVSLTIGCVYRNTLEIITNQEAINFMHKLNKALKFKRVIKR